MYALALKILEFVQSETGQNPVFLKDVYDLAAR